MASRGDADKSPEAEHVLRQIPIPSLSSVLGVRLRLARFDRAARMGFLRDSGRSSSLPVAGSQWSLDQSALRTVRRSASIRVSSTGGRFGSVTMLAAFELLRSVPVQVTIGSVRTSGTGIAAHVMTTARGALGGGHVAREDEAMQPAPVRPASSVRSDPPSRLRGCPPDTQTTDIRSGRRSAGPRVTT